MYNLKIALNNQTLTGEERNITQASFDTTRILLGENASNCMIPVCENIKSNLGELFMPKNITTFNVMSSTLVNLFMMLENGCDLSPSAPGDGGKPMYCQYLLMIQQNITDNDIHQRAASSYNSVSVRSNGK